MSVHAAETFPKSINLTHMYHTSRVGVEQTMDGSRITAVYQYRDPNVNDAYYSSDEFRMFGFKIQPCPRTRGHDWTDCPLAHPGEKAQRRDPSIFRYLAVACPHYKANNGVCPLGDSCCFAHGLFEYWLHPAKYRTRPCHRGRFCQRKVCFFAHTPEQLRSEVKYRVQWTNNNNNSYEGVTQRIASAANPFGSEQLKSTPSFVQSMTDRMDPLNMMISSIIDEDDDNTDEIIAKRLSELKLVEAGTAAGSDSGVADEVKSGVADQQLPILPDEIDWYN